MGDQNALDVLPSGLRKAADPHITPGDEALFALNGQSGQALVALQDRLLVVKKGFFTGSMIGGKVTTFHYRDITNLEQRRALMTPYLEILTPSYQNISADVDHYTADNALVLRSRKDFDRHQILFQLLRQKINEAKAGSAPTVGGSSGGGEFIEELERLARMKDAGALSEEEFRAAKQKLLS